MNELKTEFFDKGFVSNIKILDIKDTHEIFNDYKRFLTSNQSRANLVEHKSKTHLYFEWANKIIHNKTLLDNVEKILGSDRKKVQKEELEMKKISRKGIYYGIDQVKGKKINLKNLYLKRPYTNQSIFEIKKLLNKKLNKNIFKNNMLNKNDFKK